MRRILLTLGVLGTLVLGGCSDVDWAEVANPTPTPTAVDFFASDDEPVATSEDREYPTNVCSTAMETAQNDLKRLRAQAKLADVGVQEYEYESAIHPLYGKCRGPVDLMAGFKEFPYVAGVTSAAGVDRFTLIGFCDGRASDRACRGYEQVLDDY